MPLVKLLQRVSKSLLNVCCSTFNLSCLGFHLAQRNRISNSALALALTLGGCLIASATNLHAQELLTNRLLSEPMSQLAGDVEKFGDPKRGAYAFYLPTMNCARCHEAQDNSRRLGPDLTEKRDLSVVHLIESILKPSAKIKQGYETVQVLSLDGSIVSGVLVEETKQHLVVDRIESAGKPIKIQKEEIDEWQKTKKSSMPEGLANQLTNRQQFLDLVSYLNEIAKSGPVRAAQLKPSNVAVLAPLPEYESRVDHAGLIRGLNDDAYRRGEETFRLRCASCHGTVEEEGSMPTSLRFAVGKFKNGGDPYQMYQTLTHGYGMMNPQRWMVPQQKYEVIHYIREHFLKEHNPSQLFHVQPEYLASLPKGDTRGPKPVVSRPWTAMDYGPSFINTIEVSRDGSNIAQKGITVRLDDGPGGVESGQYWMMYEHDTMRLAGAWSGGFIDWEGIHFNGTHGRHPGVAGDIQFANPTGPGWGRPTDGSFEDNRLVGRDGKRYGPLDRSWAQYKGLFRFGRQTIINYTVGNTSVLEMPSLKFANEQPVFQRVINLGQRDQELVLQLARVDSKAVKELNANAVVTGPERQAPSAASVAQDGVDLDGSTFAEIESGQAFNLDDQDFTIFARIKTQKNGTIFSQTQNQDQWMPNGKSFFIRGGRLTYDIGWVGAVQSDRRVNDGKWHDVALVWTAKTRVARFFIDGKPAGRGEIEPKERRLAKPVARIGFTNDNFPGDSFFEGSMANVQFFQRALSSKRFAKAEPLGSLATDRLVAEWSQVKGTQLPATNRGGAVQKLSGVIKGSNRRREANANLVVQVEGIDGQLEMGGMNLRLVIPPGPATQFVVSHASLDGHAGAEVLADQMKELAEPEDLNLLTKGSSPLYPETLETRMIRGKDDGPFAVDVLERPKNNPWNAQLRLTGLDFLPDGDTMVASSWDGSVWKVSGFRESETLTWKRIAAGLFQPLGIKWIEGKIYATCRDQLVVLHDLNGDEEMDWYQSLNSDHQVTEHFHEFAMGLQTDDDGNFYYAKSARHAKTALVPHHGTLLKVSRDGKTTEILANGFRAANGVCINPDGSFVVTDQEGHWNPKNRINWVRPGGFYGNMFGYHDVTDDSDEAMDQPLCWITNEFDRSPSELLWVDSEKWGPLNGSLLNFSYGYGKVYIVPHENIDGQMQGGMCEFPISQFPTGVMRGRFHPGDGQLYCCGMFAWAGSQHQPGGLYRLRYTGKPVHLPVGLNASPEKIRIRLSGKVDPESANDPENFSISTWDLKRTKNYGSRHYNEQRLKIVDASLQSDGQTIELMVPELKPTWGMEINYSLLTGAGKRIQGKIHNSIFKLKE